MLKCKGIINDNSNQVVTIIIRDLLLLVLKCGELRIVTEGVITKVNLYCSSSIRSNFEVVSNSCCMNNPHFNHSTNVS